VKDGYVFFSEWLGFLKKKKHRKVSLISNDIENDIEMISDDIR